MYSLAVCLYFFRAEQGLPVEVKGQHDTVYREAMPLQIEVNLRTI